MKQGVIFLAGLGIGGVVGWFASKKYYERRLDAELEEMKEYYISKEEVVEERSEVPKLTEKPSLDDIRRKYASSDEVPFEIQQDEIEEDEDIDGYSKEEWDSIGYEQEEDWKKRSLMEIKIIDAENYGDLPNFDSAELIYHIHEDILEDEDGNEIDDRNILIGDTLNDCENDDTDIFVRNFRFATDYHIHING